MMDFSLSDEQKMFIDAVRNFIKTELAPHEQTIEDNGVLDPKLAAEIHAKSKEMGFYAMNMPEKFGGAGLSAVDTMLVEEQFGHTTDILIRRAFGNVYEALLACEGAQIERWLLPTVQGERVCSIAITETGAGSDAGGIRTKAELQADGTWLLNGDKVFISDGLVSDFFIVSAVTSPPLGAGGAEISLFLVDKGLKGFELGKDQLMMGLRGTSHLEMFFDNVVLEPICLLGERGKGFRMAMDVLGRVRLAQVGARAVGKASHVLSLMTDYANERQQFGKSIGTFQMVQQMLADSVIEINAARLMVLHAAWLLDTGQNDIARSWIAMVKVHAAEMLGRVVDRAVQVFGGMGFCKELAIERYYRDARIYRIFDGTSEIHRTVIARNVLKHGKKLYEL
jgi:acyl-CoA dehydrogenase